MKPPAGLVARGRAAAATLMVDTCTVTRQTGTTFNPDSGQYEPATTTVYTGACRMRQQTWQQSSESRTEQRTVTTTVQALFLPHTTGTSGVQVDDTVTVTASAHDPGMVGRQYRVRQVPSGTHTTARRLLVEEQQT